MPEEQFEDYQKDISNILGSTMTKIDRPDFIPKGTPIVSSTEPFEVLDGDIFASGCEALVNPVNISPGYMGALAGVFSRKYPGLQVSYLAAVESKLTGPGILHVFQPQDPAVRLIINFPTTPTVGAPSSMELILAGLKNLGPLCLEHKVKSLAIPAIGCGVGGLPFEQIEDAIRAWHDTECPVGVKRLILYRPK